ncbi:hypothetical protein SAMN05443572_106206 [Myxococcus fulvus]|uniref:Uncharacterized protein n=1 Tax=Myxococcus fulvus TaxID=33 RepID=A0A511T2I9_MYXFU|nr:hypothetical protein [Myxococcus fulvus]GEN08369.1 hypothetical protein MFU01_34060 [Myxococcus fulvus]SEU20942.1 hypothetical protein SAMN05443572_106206 [Myxococcus fulvus]
MQPTTRTKPKILFAGTTTGQDFNALKSVAEVSVKQGTDDLGIAEVLWIDCATTKPDQYAPLLRQALDSGKLLVLRHPDGPARKALADICGCEVQDGASVLMVTRDLKATTPSSYAVTALDDTTPVTTTDEQVLSGGEAEAVPPTSPTARPSLAVLERQGEPRDWAATLEAHRERSARSVGGPGLIPPQGVMYGIRTLTGSYSARVTNDSWKATQGKSQDVEFGFTSSFYVYRENGKSNADYVVIRVQQATCSPRTLMVREDNAKGYYQYQFQAQCTNNRGAPLLGTSPETTNNVNPITQISIPLHVKYLQDGSCMANYWSAAHGPVARTQEGWGLSNRSATSSGTAVWLSFHRDPWNSLNDPPNEFSRWWSNMFEGGYGGRVKTLNTLASSSFTVENVAAWRFSASMIATNRNVLFQEILNYRVTAFANPKGTNNGHHQISAGGWVTNPKSITLDVVAVAEDVNSPCK